MYKAFVSSTFEDLHLHRAEVIHTLQAAGFQVDPMENWQADREAPQKFSTARMNGCHVCILLVAFRRGHIPGNSLRSITQLEYDEARRRHIDVLPFLLADHTPIGETTWHPKFDERKTDVEVDLWRNILRQTHGVGEFGCDPKSVRIEAALTRWVVQTELDRTQRFRRNFAFAFSGLFFLLTVSFVYLWRVYETPELRNQYLSHFLAFHDPVIFSYARNGQYSIARVLADRSVFKDTNQVEEVAATKLTLDILVNNAQYTRHGLYEPFRNIIKRGGRLRIILWDYSEKNKSYNAFHEAIAMGVQTRGAKEAREGAKNVRAELEGLMKEVNSNRKTYPGSFEFRWNTRPLFYTMWIRDWNDENASGHLGLHFYRGQDYWPSFRVSSTDGKELLNNMHEEFEYTWEHSLSDNQLTE